MGECFFFRWVFLFFVVAYTLFSFFICLCRYRNREEARCLSRVTMARKQAHPHPSRTALCLFIMLELTANQA